MSSSQQLQLLGKKTIANVYMITVSIYGTGAVLAGCAVPGNKPMHGGPMQLSRALVLLAGCAVPAAGISRGDSFRKKAREMMNLTEPQLDDLMAIFSNKKAAMSTSV